jgi:hypothetical protein
VIPTVAALSLIDRLQPEKMAGLRKPRLAALLDFMAFSSTMARHQGGAAGA